MGHPDIPKIYYSIIIPHYNIPDLLMRCLASIPIREDVQVIVVDDNSPDADTYRERYPQLSRPYLEFIRTTKGGGAGYARNIGMQKALGKWLIFADADDYFTDNVSSIFDSFQNSQADIVYFRHKSVMSDDLRIISHKGDYLSSLIDDYFLTRDDNELRFRHWVPWSKLFSRSFVLSHNIRFDETPFSNDVIFNITAASIASSIIVIDKLLYVITERAMSLSNDFCMKPGELEIRSKVCYRYHKIIHTAGYKLKGRLPISDFLLQLFYRNKNLYDVIIMRLSEIGCSKWTILRQIRGWVRGLWNKTWLYFYTVFISPLHYLIIQSRTRFDDLS